MILHAVCSDKGLVRSKNEDNWCVHPSEGIYLVSDGIGGNAGGEVASKIVVNVLFELLKRAFPLEKALTDRDSLDIMTSRVRLLNHMLREKRKGTKFSGMGATLVGAIFRSPTAVIIHLGDSRAYLLKNGTITLLTKDHTLGQLLVDSGSVTPIEAFSHSANSQLFQYVGMKDFVSPETRILTIENKDRLILCSDGLTSMVAEEQMLTIANSTTTLKSLCHQMVKAANDAGGADNITVMAIEYLQDDWQQRPKRGYVEKGRAKESVD